MSEDCHSSNNAQFEERKPERVAVMLSQREIFLLERAIDTEILGICSQRSELAHEIMPSTDDRALLHKMGVRWS